MFHGNFTSRCPAIINVGDPGQAKKAPAEQGSHKQHRSCSLNSLQGVISGIIYMGVL